MYVCVNLLCTRECACLCMCVRKWQHDSGQGGLGMHCRHCPVALSPNSSSTPRSPDMLPDITPDRRPHFATSLMTYRTSRPHNRPSRLGLINSTVTWASFPPLWRGLDYRDLTQVIIKTAKHNVCRTPTDSMLYFYTYYIFLLPLRMNTWY